MSKLAEFRERCTAAALTAGGELHMLEGLPIGYLEQRRERIARLNELRRTYTAALYGCSPSAIDRAGIIALGELRPDKVDGCNASNQRHRVRDDWRTANPADFSDLRALNLELRGLSRAIWLALLWSGGNVTPFERKWYHSDDLVPYWPIAWSVTYGCPEEYKDDKRFQLISYAFAVSAEYTKRHRAGRTHKAAEDFSAAAQQWGLYD